MAYTVTVKTTDEVYSYQLRRESEARADFIARTRRVMQEKR